MVHILHRVKAVGCQPLESLKDMLTEEEYRKCATSPHIGKTWFKLTTDVFVGFLFWVIFLLHHLICLIFHCQGSCLAFTFASILMQEIAEAFDDAARNYYEYTPKEDRSDSGITAVMRAAAKSK
jgi:hypothetical protein